jgi:hypothetical protein
MKRKTTQTRHEDSTHRIAILGLPDLAADAGCTAGCTFFGAPRTSPASDAKVYSQLLTGQPAADQPQELTLFFSHFRHSAQVPAPSIPLKTYPSALLRVIQDPKRIFRNSLRMQEFRC